MHDRSECLLHIPAVTVRLWKMCRRICRVLEFFRKFLRRAPVVWFQAIVVREPWEYCLLRNKKSGFLILWLYSPESHIEAKAFAGSKKSHPKFFPVHFYSPPRAVRHNSGHMLFSNLLPASYTAEYMESDMQSMMPGMLQDQVQLQMV